MGVSDCSAVTDRDLMRLHRVLLPCSVVGHIHGQIMPHRRRICLRSARFASAACVTASSAGRNPPCVDTSGIMGFASVCLSVSESSLGSPDLTARSGSPWSSSATSSPSITAWPSNVSPNTRTRSGNPPGRWGSEGLGDPLTWCFTHDGKPFSPPTRALIRRGSGLGFGFGFNNVNLLLEVVTPLVVVGLELHSADHDPGMYAYGIRIAADCLCAARRRPERPVLW